MRIGKEKNIGASDDILDDENRDYTPNKTHFFGIGDMIGHQSLAEQDGPIGTTKWTCDIVGDQKGIIAVLPFGEIKSLMRKFPRATCRIIEMAAQRCYETTFYNFTGLEYNPIPNFVN